jgi:hypothetical protein
MANNVKINPKGLDVTIQNIQNLLYSNLLTLWNVDLDGYGRCYPVFNGQKKEIQFYSGSDEYRNVVVAETNKFFFTAENDIEKVGNTYYKTKIELYFIVNVKEIKPNALHRADEEVRVDVLNVLNTNTFAFVKNTVIDIDKVFNKFEYDYTDDLQPYHCFKIELNTVEYDINKTICN